VEFVSDLPIKLRMST